MTPMILLPVFVLGAAILWLLACRILYHRNRNLRWNAGFFSAAVLFLCGEAFLISLLVAELFVPLVPVCLCYATVGVVHLLAARKEFSQRHPIEIDASSGSTTSTPDAISSSAPSF